MTEAQQDLIVEKIMELITPCIHRSRRPEWSSARYWTAWGSKTDTGLKACIKRIIFEDSPEKPLT